MIEVRCKAFNYYFGTGFLKIWCELGEARRYVYVLELKQIGNDLRWEADLFEEKGLLSRRVSVGYGKNIEEALGSIYRGTVGEGRNQILLKISEGLVCGELGK